MIEEAIVLATVRKWVREEKEMCSDVYSTALIRNTSQNLSDGSGRSENESEAVEEYEERCCYG